MSVLCVALQLALQKVDFELKNWLLQWHLPNSWQQRAQQVPLILPSPNTQTHSVLIASKLSSVTTSSLYWPKTMLAFSYLHGMLLSKRQRLHPKSGVLSCPLMDQQILWKNLELLLFIWSLNIQQNIMKSDFYLSGIGDSMACSYKSTWTQHCADRFQPVFAT